MLEYADGCWNAVECLDWNAGKLDAGMLECQNARMPVECWNAIECQNAGMLECQNAWNAWNARMLENAGKSSQKMIF